ncbi:hypothetical protein ACFOWU_09395 [Epilithonimonas zeae]|uniref:Uncharacterized protein n=1 Tax=Epilithonimonas zeae TaxID=1416779 RepID=A0A1N6GP16_9FLAO|nr:hypothetical protein [Epilithonimonas zeae]SIO09244.1 hypothetical protein SAMN05444409_1961 [Epilithonimonas zeae]
MGDYWHYQIINTGTESEPSLGIHEVFRSTANKKVVSWTEDPIDLGGFENIESLRENLENILEAIKKHPVLLESELEKNIKEKL